MQLREKQKMRRIYGVLERQFRNTYHEAEQRKGVTGENLLQLLECRLDNVVYRMGFGASRTEARQVVRHNGDPGERQARQHPVVPAAAGRRGRGRREGHRRSCASRPRSKRAEQRGFPEWLEVDAKALKGTFKALPAAHRIAVDHQRIAGGRALFEVM